ncbi:MAG: hypothetical protein FRX48_07053 [Lasallia pustulata]|uniref:CCHC-type domain-containing protein n=1 Tax=Lasallia pustulata TaxID=136370 RepID=A0A5M8PJA1_9LECA|nr:MAG: hypothetical protein FRX48_07053 [Lasallia pustulata]
MAAQWPQHPPPPQGYGNPAYQQPYPQQYQQHYPQLPPYQQYGPPQSGPYQPPYQPPYQQPPAPTRPPQVAQPSPPTCYNCGSPDHWAQHCPEPRREVPVGSLNRQNNPRPPKRQRPNAPVITKYPVPQSPNQYGPLQTYAGAPYGQQGYLQQQAQYGPPTPMSAYPQQRQQWQQSPQHQQYQPPYQQGTPYQHYGYGPQQPPTPNASYGPLYPSPVSAQGPHHHAGFFTQNSPTQQPQGYQTTPYPSASPTNQQSPFHNAQAQPIPGPSELGYNRQGPSDYTVTYQSQSATPKPQVAILLEHEPEEDDLETLDVPDIPGRARLPAWRPAGPVSRPLPADFVMADAIMPIPPPSAEDDGPSLSKYVARENFESLDRNIKDSNHWDDLKDDPMFRPIPDDGAVVPIAELISHRNLHDDAEEGSDSEREDGELTQESNVMSDDLDSWDVMNSLEHALNAGGAPANDYHPRGEPSTQPVEQAHLQRQYEEPSSEVDTARATEERLAALGVTGMPKPVRAPARPYPPPEPQTQASPVQDLGSRGRSPRRIDTSVAYNRSDRSYSGSGSRPRERDPASPQYGMLDDKHVASPVRINSYGNSAHDQERRDMTAIPGHSGIPPPPAIPLLKSSTYDGNNESPPSSGSSHGQANGHAKQNIETENGYRRYSVDGYPISPIKLRSERVNVRKRDYDHRDSSEDERENERRRQEDDYTPKLKRRQPKVAEAYSRRW